MDSSTPSPVLRLAEANKLDGVFYAPTDDGIELPILDVGHPAFAPSMTDEELQALVERFLRQGLPLAKLPAFLRNRILSFLLRGSTLAQGLSAAKGTFLSGMTTYLFKLGPENLGRAYATQVDRRIAAALPAVAARLRLQDMTTLICEALIRSLIAGSGESCMHLLSIAGGPAMECINALMQLRRSKPELLEHRRVTIDVFDLDDAGPNFGTRAVAVLRAGNAPLCGLDISFRHSKYDWTDSARLGELLGTMHVDGELMIASSEGGLFEYGADADIVANLETLRQLAGPDFVMVGSVTYADAPLRRLHEMSQAATIPRDLKTFCGLIAQAGMQLDRAIERPLSNHVTMVRE